MRMYAHRDPPGSTSLPRCGFRALVPLPAEARTIRLESPDHQTILMERAVESLLAYRGVVDTFRVDPPIAPAAAPLLVIEGWLFRPGSDAPARLQLLADDQTILDIDCGIERPDVAQMFLSRDHPPPLRCGFRVRLPLPAGEILSLQTPDGIVLAERDSEALRAAGLVAGTAIFTSSPATHWRAHVENNAIQPHVSEMLARAAAAFRRQPTFAIVIALGRDADVEALTATVQSLDRQIYRHWELCIAIPETLGPRAHQAAAALAGNHTQTRSVDGPALSDAARAAAGQWLCPLAAGDQLAPHALFEAARALQEDDADLLYGDEDVLHVDGRRRDPSFKPAWSPIRLLSHDYVGRPAFVRRAAHDAGGGFADGEHALWLRLGAAATVLHLPGILCHRAPGPRPDPVPVVAAHLARIGSRLTVSPGHGGVAVSDGPDEGPPVEIIIPTRNEAALLRRCLESLEQTRYRPFSVTVVDDGSDDPETLALLEDARARGVKVLRVDDRDGFSFARLNNHAVAESNAELLLLLNNDTEVRDPRWLARMVALLGPSVGAVGARLLYPDGTLQHAGVLLWVNDLAPGHELSGWPADVPSPGAQGEVSREVAAVTGACLLTPRRAWRAVGGLDETFRVSLNDIDYCLRLSDVGLRTVYAGAAELLHHEAVSRGRIQDPGEISAFRARHRRRPDIYGNRNLDGGLLTPECRLDYAAFKNVPLRVAVIGSSWEAAVVHEALLTAAPCRRIELVGDGAEVVVATGVLGYREVNAAADAGRPVLWAHGGPLETRWPQRRVPREEESAHRLALQQAAWVVFGSVEARERSRPWQMRENFVVNRIAIPRPPSGTLARTAARCRVAWAGEGDAEADPWTFVRAFHRLADGLPLDVSWFYWGEPPDDCTRVRRAETFDRRVGQRRGRTIGSLRAGTVADLDGIDIFVSTGTGWEDPRPLLHATARGAAILAPYECGLGERASVGLNAWTYPCQDARALAARLETLVLDSTQRETLRRNSREVFGCLWTFDEMANRWADLVWGAWHGSATRGVGSV
jgi:GT2 family glycosyltransferase